jgi:two-component system nitrate/nitrite sensor histidine kinase NarX
VRDDGRGFDTHAGPPDETHVGLRIMRERAERIGAFLAFESTPQGTQIVLNLPNLVTSRTGSPSLPLAHPT